MSRLPVSGETDWGDILNNFLLASLNDDGTIRQDALQATGALYKELKNKPGGYVGIDDNGSPGLKLTDLQDVAAPTSNPDDSSAQVLSYDTAASAWQPTTMSALLATDPTTTVTSIAGRTGDVVLAESDITNLAADLAAAEKIARKGQPGGYASLDAWGKIPMSQIQPFPMPKQSVAVCMTTPVSLTTPGATLDGQTLPNGSRVLLVAQSPPYQNGIYSYNGANSAMTRTSDASNGTLIQNAFVYVNLGTQAQAGWENVTTGPIGINATPLTWKQFEAPLLSQPTGQLNDSNGNPVLLATAANRPANQVTITNSAAGSSPMISSSGSDTNVGLLLDTQGNGAITSNSAITITNPTYSPDLLVQNNGGIDSVIKVQGWGTKAAFVFINSQNIGYGYLAGQVGGATKWAIGRIGNGNGVSIYSGDGTKQAVHFDDNQTTKLMAGLAVKRTSVVAAAYTAIVSDYLIAYTGAAQSVTITLPSAAATSTTGTPAQVIVVKDEAGIAGANPITIQAPGSTKIDGTAAQKITTSYGSMQFYADGTNWHLLG